jgi:glycosyltransferase involved in cell wall biosynthesis
VFTNHSRYDLLTEAYLPLLPTSIIEAGIKAYLSSFFEICDLVIVPSLSMHNVLKDYLEASTPVQIIPHGLDLSIYQVGIQPVNRTDLGFSSSDLICIYMGRLSPEKNLSFLLYAFHDVAQSNPDLRLPPSARLAKYAME